MEGDCSGIGGKPNLPLGLRGKAGGCARVTAGPKRPHLGVCPGPNIPLQQNSPSRAVQRPTLVTKLEMVVGDTRTQQNCFLSCIAAKSFSDLGMW